MTPDHDDLSAVKGILTAVLMALPFWIALFFLGGWWAR